MTITRQLLLLALVPALVLLVACTDGDDDPPAAQDTGASSGSAAATDSGGPGNAGGATDSGSTDTGAGGDAAAPAILANCPEVLSFYNAFTAGAFSNPAGFENDLSTIADVFRNAAGSAPEEIRGDMTLLADAVGTFYDSLEEVGLDLSNPASFANLDAAQQAQLQAAFAPLEDPALDQAADNVDAWFSENCG